MRKRCPESRRSSQSKGQADKSTVIQFQYCALNEFQYRILNEMRLYVSFNTDFLLVGEVMSLFLFSFSVYYFIKPKTPPFFSHF